MRWYYHLNERNSRLLIYSYSRETEDLDGLIVFDVEKQTASVMRPCKNDTGSKKAQRKAIEHFGTVIEGGFPDDKYVCCG